MQHAITCTGKNFDEFRRDDNSCREYSKVQINWATVQESANECFSRSTIVGTIIGAGAAAGLFVGSF
jgi:TctA family transporter